MKYLHGWLILSYLFSVKTHCHRSCNGLDGLPGCSIWNSSPEGLGNGVAAASGANGGASCDADPADLEVGAGRDRDGRTSGDATLPPRLRRGQTIPGCACLPRRWQQRANWTRSSVPSCPFLDLLAQYLELSMAHLFQFVRQLWTRILKVPDESTS
jgi:hypothetical protein